MEKSKNTPDVSIVEAPASSEQTEVKPAPFNPFAALTLEQLTELLGKFPKQWRESHTVELSNVQTEYGISDSEAIFLVWLQDEADSRILAKQVYKTAVKIIGLVDSIGGTQSKAALDMIAMAYNELPLSARPECGIKVRDAVKKNMVTAIAEAKLEVLYKHLGVTEKQWMRK